MRSMGGIWGCGDVPGECQGGDVGLCPIPHQRPRRGFTPNPARGRVGALPRTPPEAAFEKAPLDSRKTFGAGDLVGVCLWIEVGVAESDCKGNSFL